MYAKVFNSMFEGSLRGKADAILVFVNLLTSANRFGEVDRHFRAIADETGLPLERVKLAIAELASPDAESRSHELEGRRIEPLDSGREWGWRVVNYLHYRGIRDEETRREQNREAQVRFKRQVSQGKPEVSQGKPTVSTGKQGKPESAHAEAEAEEDAERIYACFPRKIGKPAALRAIRKALTKTAPDILRERVTKYAALNSGTEQQFIPYPQKWFNEERYNDDPSTWTRCNGQLATPAPKGLNVW